MGTSKPATSLACRHNHAVASRIVTTWKAWEVSCTFSMITSFVVGFSRPAVHIVFPELSSYEVDNIWKAVLLQY